MTQTSKDRAIAFLKQVVSGDVTGAYEAYVDPDMRHHNPYYAADAESLRRGMEEDEAKHPGKQLAVQMALEDGDHVAVHSRLKHPAVATEISVVHIFRFENGRIVELWDVVQIAPEQIVNQNGMF